MTSGPGNPGNEPDAAAERFAALLGRLALDAPADEVYRVLAEGYSAPERRYHGFDRLHRCLARLDEVRPRLQDPDAAELALWFSRAVYDPGAGDNVLRSAFLFDGRLGIHLPTQRADRVHAMIMATAHPGEAADSDSRFVADIDLSDLALPRPDFLRAVESLREERGHAPGARRACFRRLLSRPHIYRTGHFRTRCEEQARRNIEGLIARGGGNGSR